ncbi:MAG: dehydrogenase [Nitrososphaeraceae archaeon]|nr:dehydrogenase [Nitrososphaeraceae archaeon]
MKIAVVGIGVAGAYLMNQLSASHDMEIIGYERLPESQHDAVCAWATSENVMSIYAKKCGLNFDDYVLHTGKHMQVDFSRENKNSDKKNSINIKLKGMVSYDKLKLIQDMIKGTKIEFGKIPKKENLESEFDLIIDSTGFHRNYLPKPEYELWIPCVQYKVKYSEDDLPFDDFYLKAFPSMSGYFWYFPLGNGYAHIGAGDFTKQNHNLFVSRFLNKYKCEIIKKNGRPVRISPPSKSMPFTDEKKTIGVGESIGTVYALLGEGIIPSTICADIFVQNIDDMKLYEQKILEQFKIYSLVFNFVSKKISGTFNLLNNPLDLLRIYDHMKSNENRYGMEVSMLNMMKVSKA